MVKDLCYEYKVTYLTYDRDDYPLEVYETPLSKQGFEFRKPFLFDKNVFKVLIKVSVITSNLQGRNLDYVFKELEQKMSFAVMKKL